LKEKDIHFSARIVGLADVIDALGSHKTYRAAMPKEEIVEFLKENSGSMFDPDLTEHALGLMDEFQKIRLTHPDIQP
jgi:putative two-component system response regulator